MWFKPVDDHYEYLARYVDDVIAFSKDPLSIIKKLQDTYMMKDVGKPQYYLGGDILQLSPDWEKEGITGAFSAETYITNVLPKLAKSCGLKEFSKAKIPFSESYYPELNKTDLLSPGEISIYKSLLG